MKKIDFINLDIIYKDEFCTMKSDVFNYGLEELLKKIQEENNPVVFKEYLLSITQLYYDGVLNNQELYHSVFARKSDDGSLKLKILNKLILAGKMSIGSFYEGNGIDVDKVRDIFMSELSNILKYGETDISSKFRHLKSCSFGVQKFGIGLQERLNNLFEIPDVIVSVASGGFEPAYLAMHIMEKDDLFVLRYSKYKNDSTVQVLENNNSCSGDKLTGQKVFVIDDVIEFGDTMFEVSKYISNFKPLELYGSSVLTGYITPLVSHIDKIGSKPFLFKYNLKS